MAHGYGGVQLTLRKYVDAQTGFAVSFVGPKQGQCL